MRSDFERDGYIILKSTIDHQTLDEFWGEFVRLREHDPLMMFAEYGTHYLGHELEAARRSDLRVINLQSRSPRARRLASHPVISAALEEIFGDDMCCIQTLAYSKSSQQGAHSDYYLVSPPYVGPYDRDTLCAAWIACEDSDEENGALVIYPGSHKLKKATLTECNNDYRAYVKALQDACVNSGIEPKVFRAKKGEVLIWHGDFVHAGGIPKDPLRTRASYVCHYAAVPKSRIEALQAGIFRMNGSACVLSDSMA
jgi:ectoine hydroxylase-related dioxygenase (phytanoyl-CoA dioxygenase family)